MFTWDTFVIFCWQHQQAGRVLFVCFAQMTFVGAEQGFQSLAGVAAADGMV